MFSHLKAEDFVNLMEGSELPDKQRTHIAACARCRTTWESIQSVHSEITSLDADVPEPDWGQFRSTVRDELLSRSIQRQSTVRRWTGWAVRPAMAWALSLFMAVGITTMTVVWRMSEKTPAEAPITDSITPTDLTPEASVELIESGPERSLFDDVVSLGEEEQKQFRLLLESEEKDATSIQ